jgi:tetratricopeptide (TPR) repeat protein
VVEAGYSFGVGRGDARTWITPVESFKIGEEEIRNTRLRIADADFAGRQAIDMLLGADFFLSHHIYIANSQKKLYFTYNGGPVFNLTGAKYAKTDAAPPAPASAPADGSTPPAPSPEEAAEHSRRGEAFASRRDFDQALAELNRACELAPDNPDYFYQRGRLYWQTNRGDAALQDFDQAIKLRPNAVTFLMSRAELILPRDRARAIADLDAAAASLANSKESNAHYELAVAYQRADALDPARNQISIWIDAHPNDVNLYPALSFRCFVGALQGKDLEPARKDCDMVLRHARTGSPLQADATRWRGLIRLRSGDYQKSIDDFNTSLSAVPQNAVALYGRGLDELRTQDQEHARKDIAAASAVRSKIEEYFTQHGIGGQ